MVKKIEKQDQDGHKPVFKIEKIKNKTPRPNKKNGSKSLNFENFSSSKKIFLRSENLLTIISLGNNSSIFY